MLGLGMGAGKSVAPQGDTQILLYTSDFTLGPDSWNKWPSTANLTVSGNQTAPDGTTGCLRASYATLISGGAGGASKVISVPAEAQGATRWRYKGKVYFEESAGEWGGQVNDVRHFFANGSVSRNYDVNTFVDFDVIRTVPVPAMVSSETAYLYVDTDDTTVLSGAKWYLRDVKIYAIV